MRIVYGILGSSDMNSLYLRSRHFLVEKDTGRWPVIRVLVEGEVVAGLDAVTQCGIFCATCADAAGLSQLCPPVDFTSAATVRSQTSCHPSRRIGLCIRGSTGILPSLAGHAVGE